MELTMRILKLLIPFLILHSSFLKAAENTEYEILKKTSFFSLGMNGFAGKISDGEMAYNAILNKNNSKDIFIRLAKDEKATPEAKLYAACGLIKLSYREMDPLFLPYKKNKITLLKGDVLRRVSFYDEYTSVLKHGCE
ncbi:MULTISPECIES: MchS3 family protein [Serratia]|jgi:hypothetical protein|uniref:MchS3 family protein n=1 Tax=Serratia TaxID=613 RepID=UPI0018D665EE|nr:hypothetical protein [Serratia marcescens]MBI6127003.1 hypothetical protein [Serratia marcescens]MDU6304992.1 MchS3 family protein [Serratia marcescens]HAT4910578.1 hypothetical protein [Serratia marcescens]HEP1046319.1 hypothetical protein [Serratia marcescens]